MLNIKMYVSRRDDQFHGNLTAGRRNDGGNAGSLQQKGKGKMEKRNRATFGLPADGTLLLERVVLMGDVAVAPHLGQGHERIKGKWDGSK